MLLLDQVPLASPKPADVQRDDLHRTAFGHLDASQAAVLSGPDRLVRVLGAPGTGKTTVVLATALARMTVAGLRPGQCLVVTGDRRRAGELRARLTHALGRAVSHPVARTFSSFAYDLLRRQAIRTGAPAPRLLTGADQDAIVRELLAGHAQGVGRVPQWPAWLAAALPTRGLRAELRDLLIRAIEYGLSSADLERLADEHEVPVWAAASTVLAEYDEVVALSRPGWYDPSWVIGAASALIETDPTTRQELLAEVVFLAIDDAHELTPTAAGLIEQLASLGIPMLLAGDPDCATQTFRGGDPRLFAGQWPLLASATTFVLQVGYRQGQHLAQVSARVADRIGTLGAAGHRQPHAQASTPGTVQVALARSAAAEARLIAAHLRGAHLLDGVPYAQMAVIARGGARCATVRRILLAEGVPVVLPSAVEALRDQPAARALLDLLQVVVRLAADQAEPLPADLAIDLLCSPLGGLDALGLRALRRRLRHHELASSTEHLARIADELLVASLLGDPIADEIGPIGQPLRRLAAVIDAGRRAAIRAGHTGGSGWSRPPCAESILWAMWESADLAAAWRELALAGGSGGHRADRDLDAVIALFQAAANDREHHPGRGPEGFLAHVLGQEVAVDALAPRAHREDAVTVTTPAGSAGRQWQVVAVAGVQEGQWPDLRVRGSLLGVQRLSDVLTGAGGTTAEARAAVRHDELRLFYVALTRASRQLLVTAVRSDDEQPSALLDLIDPQPADHAQERPYAEVPVMSLPAMVAKLRRETVTSPSHRQRREAAQRLARLAGHGVRGAHPQSWWSLRELSDERDRVPEQTSTVSPSHLERFTQCQLAWFLATSEGPMVATPTASAVGQLVHALAAQLDNGDLNGMLTELDRRWPSLHLPQGWVGERHREQAEQMVTRLHRHHEAALGAGWRVVGREVALETVVDGVTLRGRLDRIERHEDGRVRVIDLKTGSSKPTLAQLRRHPQLGAYQLLIERSESDSERSDGGGDRIEPGGAALLQLGRAAAASSVDLQIQPPLQHDEEPGWAAQLVREAGVGMSGAQFTATVGPWCRTCAYRSGCPTQAETGLS